MVGAGKKRTFAVIALVIVVGAGAFGAYTIFNNYINSVGPTATPSQSPSPTSSPSDLVRQNFISAMSQNGITAIDAANFYGNWTADVNSANGNYSGFVSQVKLHTQAPTAYAELHRNVSGDQRVTIDRPTLLSQSSQDIVNLGYNGKDKVLNPDGTYRIENLNKESVQFLGNLSLAAHQLNLTLPSASAVQLVTNMSQNNPNVINYEPIKVSGDFNITAVPSRAAWDTVQQVKAIKDSGFDIEKHPEMGLAVSAKVIADEWSTFDNPYGIKYRDPTVTVNDQRYSDLTGLQSKLYLQFAPVDGGNKTYNDFKSWDSDAAKVKNPGMSGLRQNLFGLFYLDPGTIRISDGKIITGIEGAKTSLPQAAELFRTIISLYPNGTIPTQFLGQKSPLYFYYGFLEDRAGCGLNNTISDFAGGWDRSKIYNTTEDEWIKNPIGPYGWIQNQNGPLQFVEKTDSSYKLAEFIQGYIRGSQMPVDELDRIQYIMPAVLRMAGFPTSRIHIQPTPSGASPTEVAVGLQQVDAQNLQQNFPNENILFGPWFGPYSMGNGLVKDGQKPSFSYG